MHTQNHVNNILIKLPKCSVKQYLALCEDAVFVCSEDGSVMTSNDKARKLLSTDRQLEGESIRELFSFPYSCNLPPEAYEVIRAFDEDTHTSDRETQDVQASRELEDASGLKDRHFSRTSHARPDAPQVYSAEIPFYKDAISQVVICGEADSFKICRLRCQLVDENYGIYLVVVHELELMWEYAQKQLEEVSDLKRFNKRLQGALNTIVQTIHADDIHTLFADALNNLQETMESDSVVIYLAEKDGFHLQEASSMYEEMPIYMPLDSGLAEASLSQGKATAMHVVDAVEKPGDFQLVKHFLVREAVGETLEVPSYHMVPFQSFLSIPIWYGKHIIALIFVGWEDDVEIVKEDSELFDSIAQYLSVQIMGASRVLRSKQRQKIAACESSFYDRMNEYDEVDKEIVLRELKRMAASLGIKLRSMSVSPYSGFTLLESERFGDLELPFNIDEVIDVNTGQVIRDIESAPNYRLLDLDGPIMQWVNNNFDPSRIATIDFGKVFGTELICALVRPIDTKPFDRLELKLFVRIGNYLQNLSKRIASSKTNQQISKALQQGMKNTLQEVPGIISHAVYSSATAQASVGGDFYDLIKLPDNRACVIMGDVSGKGVEAASVSAAVKTSLGAYAWTGLPPCEMVRNLNHFMMGFSRFETFVTLFVGLIDLDERKMTYCSAGHPPTFMYRAKDGVLDLLRVQSGVVGAFDDMRYCDGVVDLAQGDSIYLYTDGVIEARAEDGAFFGERNLREVVLESTRGGIDTVVDDIIDAITTFTNDHLEDDSAVVVLEFNFEDERL